MNGTFYAIGVGPGDPELLTLKAVNRLQRAEIIYVPTSRLSRQSWLADAVKRYASEGSETRTVEFSLGADAKQRQQHWGGVAAEIVTELQRGNDVAFVTLGDPLLYSTNIYLLRALRERWAEIAIEVVPGISAYSHVAALTEFAVGEGDNPVTILPTVMDRATLHEAVKQGGTLVLMKIGKRLPQIIDLLDEFDLLLQSVLVARAGLPDQRIETDLHKLREASEKAGNLAVILVDANK